ncbi:hypothetical protein [Ruegeria sp.]|uniref:hypothetical protein n=1 Tax=Ruegeria sp. TaxID=1879320 RepID=UPI003C7B08BE
MNDFSRSWSPAFLSVVFLFTFQAHVASAHPGHTYPELPGVTGGCTTCDEKKDVKESVDDLTDEGNSGDDSQTSPNRLASETKSLLNKTEAMQKKIATLNTRMSKSVEAYEKTGKLSGSMHRQVMRSVRSARRSNQRLARELGRFFETYSEDLTPEIRSRLEIDLGRVETQAFALSDYEATMKDANKCASDKCAEDVKALLQSDRWSSENNGLLGLSEVLGEIYSVSAGS